MMRGLIALLLLSVLANAAIVQSYVHTVSADGSSTMAKTVDVTLFSQQISSPVLQKLDAYCKGSPAVPCRINATTKSVTIIEKLTPGGYYTNSVEYGIPLITYRVNVTSLPNDMFSTDLDRILKDSGAIPVSGSGVGPLVLTDKETNGESIPTLRRLRANLTYSVTMPAGIAEAHAGKVKGKINGSTATFDLIDVMEEGAPIVVVTTELNSFLLVALIGVAVVLWMTYSFFFKQKRRK